MQFLVALRANCPAILDALVSPTAPEVYFVHVATALGDGLATANFLDFPLTLPCCSLEDTLANHTYRHGSYFVDRSYVHTGCRMARGKHFSDTIGVETNVTHLRPAADSLGDTLQGAAP